MLESFQDFHEALLPLENLSYRFSLLEVLYLQDTYVQILNSINLHLKLRLRFFYLFPLEDIHLYIYFQLPCGITEYVIALQKSLKDNYLYHLIQDIRLAVIHLKVHNFCQECFRKSHQDFLLQQVQEYPVQTHLRYFLIQNLPRILWRDSCPSSDYNKQHMYQNIHDIF